MWDQIRANQRRSRFLLFLMFLLWLGVGASFGVVLLPENQETGILGGMAIGLFLFLVQYFVYASTPETVVLSGWDAKEVSREELPQLHNVVEEMTIAAGLKKPPRVYLIYEDAPNAFAFGQDEDRACVAVTSGLLDMLNRSELQGVIAHEIGHIRNRDIKFMTLAAVMLGTIVVLSDLAIRILYYGGGRSRRRSSSQGEGQAQAIIFLVALIFIILSPLVAQLLYFASSRRREYLADASGAMFTRYPEGLASALEKIAYAPIKMTTVNRATAPMFIVNPLKATGGDSLFSTHPPVEKRIAILRSMAGAGLVDYAKAAEKVLGTNILPPSALNEVSVPLRTEPTSEADVTDALTPKDVLRARSGYKMLTCDCGLTMKVPPTLGLQTVPCPRCGASLTVPAGEAAVAVASGLVGDGTLGSHSQSEHADKSPTPETEDAETLAKLNNPNKPDSLVLNVARKPRRWQTIECGYCQQPIQLSPAFSAKWIRCPRCGVKLIFPESAPQPAKAP